MWTWIRYNSIRRCAGRNANDDNGDDNNDDSEDYNDDNGDNNDNKNDKNDDNTSWVQVKEMQMGKELVILKVIVLEV